MSWHEVASLIVSVLSLCGFGVISKHFWDDRHAKKLAESEEQKILRKEQRQQEIREVIQEELCPIKEDVKEIKKQQIKNIEGTVTLLRDQMKQILDGCKRRGCASTSDKANYKQLYKTYDDLGGNHFKEYVDEWKEEMEALPVEVTIKVPIDQFSESKVDKSENE